jgi:lipopolysaccharide biosynthesis glycosyltransferase
MIHIACNIDTNFVRHCAVTLVSLFENNRAERFCVHIVTDHLSPSDRDTLSTLAARYDNEVCFYTPPADLLADFSIKAFSKRISMATYYRCMFSVILPADVSKVLYLDCDIIVMAHISEFWDTDITEHSAACVQDIGYDESERYDVLQYDPAYSYFNAGVLLINLDYWRAHRIDQRCIDYFHAYPERIRFNDQDLLNAVLHTSKPFVPLKWNMQDGYSRYGMDTKAADPEAYRTALLHPAILHYTNKKPWNYDSMHPLRGEYFKYLDMTPWKGERPLSSPLVRIKRWAKLLPYRLGIRQPKYLNLH